MSPFVFSRSLLSLLLILSGTLFFACSPFNPHNTAFKEENSVTIKPHQTRSIAEAWDWAEKSLRILGPETKSTSNKRIIESFDVFTLPCSKGSAQTLDTLYYVFNFADNCGFSIISAPSALEPILAVTEAGHFIPGQPSGVDGFDLFMDGLTERLPAYRDSVPEMSIVWGDYDMHGDSVNRNVGVKWGQDDIYGQFCPNAVSGCVPTAVAQIMAYHEWPQSFVASCNMGTSIFAGDTISLNWTNIKQHIQYHFGAYPCNPYHDYISAIMRENGVRLNTIYYTSPAESGTDTSDVPSGFSSYGYSTSSIISSGPTFTNKIKTNLKNHGPVYMDGYRVASKGVLHGHAWVADEYKDYEFGRYRYFVSPEGLIIPGSLQWVATRQVHCLHINWGWDGDCNGFFNFGVYNIDNAVSYDGTHGTTGRNYDTDVIMIAVYQPNQQ